MGEATSSAAAGSMASVEEIVSSAATKGIMREIKIFDTTLRDGEQAPGNSMSVATKISLFEEFDSCGVDFIESGFPAASAEDFQVTRDVARKDRKATVTAFARASEADIDKAIDAFDGSANTQIQVLFSGSETNMRHKRRLDEAAVLEEIPRLVRYAKARGADEVSLGYEDATRGSYKFLESVIDAGLGSGGTTVVLADTVGCALPEEIASLVSRVRSFVGDDVSISIHCHNDLGLAVANTLSAVKAGADVMQTTFCGIGERTGNAAVEEVLACLWYKRDLIGATSRVDLREVYKACLSVLGALTLEPWKHKSILGRYAFSTAAGMHASGLANDPLTYEFVQPELFGRVRETLFNRSSGRANLRIRLDELGLPYDAALIGEMYGSFCQDADPMRYNEPAVFVRLYEDARRRIAQDTNALT